MDTANQITFSDKISLIKVETKPYAGQKPGTSGLRKKVSLTHIKIHLFRLKM